MPKVLGTRRQQMSAFPSQVEERRCALLEVVRLLAARLASDELHVRIRLDAFLTRTPEFLTPI
jgi:hypothetical protein